MFCKLYENKIFITLKINEQSLTLNLRNRQFSASDCTALNAPQLADEGSLIAGRRS